MNSKHVAARGRFFELVESDRRNAETAARLDRGQLASDTPEARASAVAAWNRFQELRQTNPFEAARYRAEHATLITAGGLIAAEQNDDGPAAA